MLVVVVHSAEQIFLLQGLQKPGLLFWRVAVNTFYISVFIWYDDSFNQIKLWNGHEVTLRAVPEMIWCKETLSEHV